MEICNAVDLLRARIVPVPCGFPVQAPKRVRPIFFIESAPIINTQITTAHLLWLIA
jgi:hypothetical protein